MPKVRQVGATIAIGGTQIPVLQWECTLSSNGQLATVTARSSVALLDYYGIDIIGLSQAGNGADFDVYAGYNGDYEHLFGGILDSCQWRLGHDEVHLKALDYGVVLRDTNATVASLQNYRNQTIGQIITQIANKNGFTPQVTDPGILAGAVMNNENSYNPHPQPYWSMIQNLAEQVGYDYYVTPNKTLYFGPEQTQGAISMTWGALPTDDPPNPLKELDILYQPRDASNFQVKVISHDPAKVQLTSGTATSPSVKIKKKSKKKSPTQIIGTSNGSKSSVGSSGGKPSTKTTFLYRMDGLTAEQCENKAQSIAKDIAKRLIVVEGTIEGLPSLVIHSQITLVEGQLSLEGFDGPVYNASEVRHEYVMPQGFGGSGGFLTHFKALAEINQ